MTKTVSTALLCPACGSKGRPVQPLTLRSLLKEAAAGQVIDGEYRFCESKDCDVTYFTDGQTFTKSDLKVPVGVKETTGDRPLCYCFGHSVASIKDELRTKGRSDAPADIRQKMKQPGCRCETENPAGVCCLGTVAQGIETAKAELGRAKSPGNKAETFTKIGAVVAAVIASSCCWLPLVLLLVGVSGAGISSVLESYRPVFMVLTFGFLAAAFYLTFRPRKSAATGEDCCATTTDCCSTGSIAAPRHSGVIAFNKVMLIAVTVLAVAFLFFPNYVGLLLGGNSGAGAGRHDDPLVRQTILSIEGMHCEGCTVLVESSIEDVAGVLDVKVDYEKKQAIVSTSTCCPFPKDEVEAAVRQAGYSPKIVETE